ncbi:sensor domain-containing diguanylate cyclase [Dyella sp. LX-66]|uniref:sensor domain-containing diguanylate cyclase n=1 Tax=unclassified Dyella TaxID=2634549 RepID=UPI001BDFF672|nr:MULTISPECIES: sensor domain-containing diguanylate cyclase [unclassified Dyella]MBT2116430.1 sensor domain-containing diguanylate cyclase [Dyella sp. LX-1]MBT2140627.1 sensor domain-containing diguanylate cyclase [Dyella sp. LX-66]
MSYASIDFVSVLADSVTGAQTLEELVRPLLELLQAVTGLESTYLTRIDTAAGVQHVVYARNTLRLQIPEGLEVPWEGTLCKRALEEGRLYTDDVANCWADSEAAMALGIATYTSTPVRIEDGTLYGTLCAASGERKPLADGAEKILYMFSRLIGQQIERERLVHALRQANDSLAVSALTDTTTHLPNRRALMEEMRRRLAALGREGGALAVAFVDLDKFKAINDHYGHEVGDQFLAAIGGRLQSALRAGDFVARLGGDEFVVLSHTPHDGDADVHATSMRTRLQIATSGHFGLAGATIDYAGPSIGMIVATRDAHDAEALIAQADAAMYADKRQRKSMAAGVA